MGDIVEWFVALLVVLLLLGLPTVLTFYNLKFLLSKMKKQQVIREVLVDRLILVLGPIYSLLYIEFLEILNHDWNVQLYNNQKHSPIFSESYLTIIVLVVVAIIGYAVLRFNTLKKLPPLIIVLSMSAVYLGVTLCIVWSIHVLDFFLILFPFNCIILALKQIKKTVENYSEESLNVEEHSEKDHFLSKGYFRKIIGQSKNWSVLALILALPLLGVIICILTLFGQRPDAVVKAWTETSEWGLSQKISPPNVFYDEHYLCSVAARGHKRIVKPIRVGVRHQHYVVVNRQLCIANAFEQIIEEKAPKIHRFIRLFYDTYGYHFAKKIQSPYSMDIIYLIMKPLEWVFLIVIYLVDQQPENRIAMQYITPVTEEFTHQIKNRKKKKTLIF